MSEFKPRVVDECKKTARRHLGHESTSRSGVAIDDLADLEAFLEQDFNDVEDAIADLEGDIRGVISQRLAEARKIINIAPLASIFLIGSTLEGILLDVAIRHASVFVKAGAAPQRDGKALPINTWRLSSLIDVAHEVGFVSEDVKRFGHVLRDYRNFVHPRAQAEAGLYPTSDTAKMCFQVLKAAVSQIDEKIRS